MGARSQKKGRAGELELADLLNSMGYTTVRAGKCSSYGQEADVTGLRGVHVECKRVERLNLEAAMRQSIEDAEKFHDGRPAVFHRRNGKGWLVTMPIWDWARMYGAAIGQPPENPARRPRKPQDEQQLELDAGTPPQKYARRGQRNEGKRQ